ncbi:MAG: PAS domain S-box protein [Polyangiaceae bacterium]
MLDPELAEAVLRAADVAGIGVTGFVPDAQGGRYLFASRAAADMLGYSVDELVQSVRPNAVIAASARETAEAYLASWLEGRLRTGLLEIELVRKDGGLVPVEVAFTSTEWQGETVAVSFLFERSQRRSAELALRESEARFRDLIEHAPDGIGIIQDGRFVYANARAAHIFGYPSPSVLKTKRLEQLFEASDVALMGARIRSMLLDGARFPPFVYTCIRADDARVKVEVTSIPTLHAGRPAALGFARDVTERTRMDAQLAQADRLVALGTLAAGVAHEINNPLTFFYLRLDALERWLLRLPESVRAEGKAQLDELRDGAERVTRIVRDLRTFSRSADQPRGPVALAEVFAFVERITRSEHQEKALVVVECDEVPNVWGEQGRLEQVFLNLALNALQAFVRRDPEHNRVWLRARAQGDDVIAEVTDNGPGMAPDVAARVFDPFFTTKPVGVGTGLGLSICHGIVNQLGGEIGVESELGNGSTFRLRLPRCDSNADALQRRVLLVDADPESLAVLRGELGRDYDFAHALSRQQAAERLAEMPDFAAFVVDLTSAGSGGVELFEDVRKATPELSRRFVFLTGEVHTDQVDRFLGGVSAPRVRKPVSGDALRAALKQAAR